MLDIHVVNIVATRRQAQQAVMDPQAIADLIAAAVQQAAQQAAQAAAAQAQPAQVQPGQGIHFARSPALAQPALIYYNTASGAKIFSKATEALPTTFSLSAPNIKVFLNELTTQQQTFGWENIMRVNIAPAGKPQVFCNIIDQHGRVSYEHVVQHANTFIDANNRDTQNDFQLFKCLNSTSERRFTLENNIIQFKLIYFWFQTQKFGVITWFLRVRTPNHGFEPDKSLI